jgi:hypothetical protein
VPEQGKSSSLDRAGRGVGCVNNLRQLMLAWKMYIDDNNDKLVRNASFNGIARYRADSGGRIHDWLDYKIRIPTTQTF